MAGSAERMEGKPLFSGRDDMAAGAAGRGVEHIVGGGRRGHGRAVDGHAAGDVAGRALHRGAGLPGVNGVDHHLIAAAVTGGADRVQGEALLGGRDDMATRTVAAQPEHVVHRRRLGRGQAVAGGAGFRQIMAGFAVHRAAVPAVLDGRDHRTPRRTVAGGAVRMQGEALLGTANDMAARADGGRAEHIVDNGGRGVAGAVQRGGIGLPCVAACAVGWGAGIAPAGVDDADDAGQPGQMAFPAVVQMDGENAVKVRGRVAARTGGMGAEVVVGGIGQVWVIQVMADTAVHQPLILIVQGAAIDAGGMGGHVAGGAGAAVSGVDGVLHLGAAAGVAAQAVALMGICNDVVAGMADHALRHRPHLAVGGAGVAVTRAVTGFAGNRRAGVDPAGQDGVDLGCIAGQMTLKATVLVDADDILEGCTGVAALTEGHGPQVVMGRVGQIRIMTDCAVTADDLMHHNDIDRADVGIGVAAGAGAAGLVGDGLHDKRPAAGMAARAVAGVDVGDQVDAGVADHALFRGADLEVQGKGMRVTCAVTGFTGATGLVGDGVNHHLVGAVVAAQAHCLVDAMDEIGGAVAGRAVRGSGHLEVGGVRVGEACAMAGLAGDHRAGLPARDRRQHFGLGAAVAGEAARMQGQALLGGDREVACRASRAAGKIIVQDGGGGIAGAMGQGALAAAAMAVLAGHDAAGQTGGNRPGDIGLERGMAGGAGRVQGQTLLRA